MTTEGDASTGIFARADNGNATVHGNNVTTLGAGSVGILARSVTGGVSVTSDGIVDTKGAGSIGIDAFTTGGTGSVTVDAATIHTRGNSADGMPAVMIGILRARTFDPGLRS